MSSKKRHAPTQPTQREMELIRKLGSLSDVLIEHIQNFDTKLDELAEMFEDRIDEMVEQKVAERLKELDK